MKHENFGAEQELPRQAEQREAQEEPRSPEEVSELVTEESENLIANGEDKYEELVYELSESDPKVSSFREHLTSIANRAKELSKWAAASLALSMAQPGLAQESVPQQVATSQTEAGQSYELQYDNPQRAGYASPEGYRKYLSEMWKDYKRTMQSKGGFDRFFVEGVKAGRLMSDSEIQEMSISYQEAMKKLDAQREWLAKITNSPEYRRRYLENEGMTEEDLQERKRRVAEDIVRLVDPFHQFDDPYTKMAGIYQEESFYPYNDMQGGRAVISKEEALRDGSATAMHESQHHVVGGDKTMSSKAAELYKKAFNTKIYEHLVPYLSRPGEIDAYKREFEYEFGNLTGWHYGEPFTVEHARSARQLFKEKKLISGDEFLKLLDNENFEENLIEIMNTLAANETDAGMGEERIEKA